MTLSGDFMLLASAALSNALVLLWGFTECGNRKALRLKVQGVYLCK